MHSSLTTLQSDYATSGALQDPSSFGSYAQPSYTPQLLYSSSGVDNAQDAGQLNYVSSPDFAGQHHMMESRSAMIDERFRHFPQVTSSSQLQGLQGSTVTIYIQTIHELRTSPRISFALLFASKRVDCALQLITDSNTSPKQYAVAAEVPLFTSTGWAAFNVPLRMMMHSSNPNISPLVVDVGVFSYRGQVIPQNSSRKRRLSSESVEAGQSVSKKSSALQLQNEHLPEDGVYNTSPYSPFNSTAVAGSVPQNANPRESSPQLTCHKYSASVASATSVKAQSPHTPSSWSPSFTPVNQTNAVPKSSATPSQGSVTDAPTEKTPTLFRTSTIQQSSAAMNAAVTSHSFNPYAMYPSKAVLKLNGDLDLMAEGWSLEEWDAKRRLIQFTRRQNGSTILADFKAVAPEDRQPNSICISCIWWEEKKDCFVTSVDTIFLLESLVAVRFTVEEKNRIRRNLEGFRPLTVSKSKADSEDFFKVIMGFPSPKPRNIEKDVKVFPWKILAHALKKIIGKYSASYSSTAGALPTPMGSHYASNGASDSGTDVRGSTSPPLNGISSGASPYPVSTASFSPHLAQQPLSVPITTGPPTDLRLQVPSMIPGYSYPATHSHQPSSHYSHAMRRSPQVMTAPPVTGRIVSSWDGGDYTTFENGHQGSNANMNGYSYNRILSSIPTSQGYIPATSYPISQPGI
jgi:hypothetical protein